MKTKLKKLVGNTLIFAIGNMGSKLIGFLLIPFLTRALTTSQYGNVDLFLTTANMLLPVLTLSLADGVFRFVLDSDEDSSAVISSAIFFTAGTSVIISIISVVFRFTDQKNLSVFSLYLACALFQLLLQNYVKADNQVLLFSINGIISSITTAIFCLFEVVFLRQGVSGYLYAMLGSVIISVVILLVFGHVANFFSPQKISFNVLKRMLRYSVPLIPNAFLWFFTNEASRFFIMGFLGLSANGLYAVATKIPTIINVFYTMFAQAWQISAIDEYESRDRDEFYSLMFNANMAISVMMISVVCFFAQYIISVIAGPAYRESWKIVPVLLIASFFSNLSSFLGTSYLAAKKTSGMMSTTILGMFVNVAFNLMLIPQFGLQGAGFGAAIGFFVVMIARLIGTRRFVLIRVDWIRLCISMVLIVMIVIFRLLNFSYFFGLVSMVIIVVINVPVITVLFGRRGG